MPDKTEFTVDTSEIQKAVKTAARMFPTDGKKPVARLLGDMAWAFKQTAPDVIGKRLTVRNPGFLKGKAFSVERPKASSPIDEMEASAFSVRIDESGHGLFTGFSEFIEGGPYELRDKDSSEYGRPVFDTARGGTNTAMVMKNYRLNPKNEIPSSGDYGMPVQNFIGMMGNSPEKTGKGKTFIISKKNSGRWKPGLYKIKKGKSEFPNSPDVEMLQIFKEAPQAEKFDWQSETVREVEKKFTPAYIFEKYIAPLFEKLWK